MRRRRARLTARWIFQESGSSQDLGVAVVAPALVLVVAALRVRRQLLPLPLLPPIRTPSPDRSSSRSPGADANLPLQPWAAELKKKRMADNSKDNPDVWCLPIGLMQYHNHPQPRQIVQTKNLMLITYESNYGLRYIYMDGRPAPNNDPTPWWFGYSRGWWEGNDTLVVETTNFRGDERAGWLDVNGSPYTDALKMTERFRRPNFGTMEIDVTIDDPKAYTKPFTVRVNHRIMVDSEMFEFICNENERSSHHIEPPEWTKKPATTK